MMIATIIAAAAFVQPVTINPVRAQQQPMDEIMRRILGRQCPVQASAGLVAFDRCTVRARPIYGSGTIVSFPSSPQRVL